MTHRLSILISTTVLFVAVPAVSRADVMVFTNFGAGFSYNTLVGNIVGNGFDGNTYAQGATFTAGTTTSLSSLDIALSCVSACGGTISVQLNLDNGGQPGALLESFTVSGASLGAFGSNHAPVVLNSVLNPLLTA